MKVATKSTKNFKLSTPKTNVKKVPRALDRKTTPWIEDYQDFFTYRMQPVSEGFLERLANELITYAENSEILRIEWFFTSKRIDPTTGRDWAAKYENFGKAYKIAKLIIGMRREDGGLKMNLSSAMVLHSMPLYDETYKELLVWKAKMQSESEGKGQSTINVIMNPVESSDMVPVRKQKERE